MEQELEETNLVQKNADQACFFLPDYLREETD